MRRGAEKTLVCLGAMLSLFGAGCSKDQGIEVTPTMAAELAKKQQAAGEKQIADIEKDPAMPPEQKQRIIQTIRAGMARAAEGSKSGQSAAQASTKK